MKQDVIEYMVDSFFDYQGLEHKLVACALSQSPYDPYDTLHVAWLDDDYYAKGDSTICDRVKRMITIGIAVCNPTDKFDEERGKSLALNKALHCPNLPRLYATAPGVISTELARSFMKQELEFAKKCPDRLIKGYDEAEARFKAREALKEEVKNLSDTEKIVLNAARNGVDITKCAKLAQKLVDKNLNESVD